MVIDEIALTEYALGILSPAESDRVRQAVARSPELQKEISAIEIALQAVAQSEPAISPTLMLRQRIVDAIRHENRFNGFLERFADMFDLDKQISESLLVKIDQPQLEHWEVSTFPGIKVMKFSGGSSLVGATCGIVQVAPGKLFPAHRHNGEEQIFVLQGHAIEDSGREFSAGDRIVLAQGSQHSFRVSKGEIFIFAVILSKENRWLWCKTLCDYFRLKKFI